MEKVSTDKAPAAIGPYSQAVKSNDLIFTSGQIALDPSTMKLVDGDITKQAEQVFQNLKAVLEAAGSSLEKAVKVNVYLKNIEDFQKINEIYEKYFSHKPARATVEVSRLPKDALIEIDAIAEQK
jgi:2-iminobutanoate/2-iminopropanoate deaminase|tara:strand:+ start:26102 stop:26476 length:375 start_codon:yes stop_codon:yes gene_type:complete